jgi:hypothetical protein
MRTIGRSSAWAGLGAVALLLVVAPSPARAGGLGWLDEVVQQVVREADVGGRAVARGEARVARSAGKLFAHEADATLEGLARRSEALARMAGRADEPAEAVLKLRFQRLVKPDATMARTFDALKPAEKRLVVEMGEAAQILARRYPGQADAVIRKLGVEGLSAVRAYGDDVAEVIVKEGPETVGILRKTGRGGWRFFQENVLPHKGKLAAAGVFALFVAYPEQFVDTAGRATQYAVEQFARAGVQLAGGIGGGAARGLERAVGGALAAAGLDHPILRGGIVAAAIAAIVLAVLVLVGLPVRWIVRPLTWPARLLARRTKVA